MENMFTINNDGQSTIDDLSDRIEWIERTLVDDEHFCQKDLDEIYDTAVKYVRSIEETLKKQLEELRIRLDQYREENINLSKKNKEIFENEIKQIDELFFKNQPVEATKQLYQYEQQFAQRPALIKRLPSLRFKELDLDQCFLFESDTKSSKSVPSTPLIEKQSRQFSFSRRLNSMTFDQISKRSEDSLENLSSMKLNKIESLVLTPVCPHQHDSNLHLIMTGNADYIVLGKSQSVRLDRRILTVIDRSNHKEHLLRWKDVFIVSIGFLDREKFYLFTEQHLITFSLDSFAQSNSFPLPVKQMTYSFSCVTGFVHGNHVYYIHLNGQSRWILSMVDYGRFAWIRDYDLTEIFPDVERYIYLSMDGQTLQFLVELQGSRYFVNFAAFDPFGTLKSKGCVLLIYAMKPSGICTISVPTSKKSLIVVNDSSAGIFHLLTTERYLQSYQIQSFAICHVIKKNELLVASTTDICSINLLTNENFFSRFLRD